MQLRPIAHIDSPFRDKFGTPRQSQIAKHSVSIIVFDKKIAPSEMLEGLEVGSYLWVIFSFHLNNQKKSLAKIHPPRLRGKTMGVLASRSPHRPNPVGLSLGKIDFIEGHKIGMIGLDLVDQTPIFDVKPYLTEFDRPKEKSPHWIRETPFPRLKVQFARGALKLAGEKNRPQLKKQIKEILKEDPRPLAYLNRPDHSYWVKYDSWDVNFHIRENTVTVLNLKPLK